MRALAAAAVVAASAHAQIDPRYADSITVYHINPKNQSAVPVNMDSGDVLGDLYFTMQAPLLPIECASINKSSSSGFSPAKFDCANPEKVDPGLMVNRVPLTVDSRTTRYSACNLCTNGTDPITHKPCTIGTYGCECAWWLGTGGPCDVKKLGRANLTGGEHVPGKKTACGEGKPAWPCWRENVARWTGGFWYSTLEQGRCNGTADGTCGWEVSGTPLRVPKTCLNNALFTTIERHGEGCFGTCGPTGPARNTSDPCWITCLYDTMLGTQAAHAPDVSGGMDPQLLVSAWESVFDSESEWGCAVESWP